MQHGSTARLLHKQAAKSSSALNSTLYLKDLILWRFHTNNGTQNNPSWVDPGLQRSENQQWAYLTKYVSNDSQGIAERYVSVICSTSESLSRIPVFLHGTLEGPLPPLTSCVRVIRPSQNALQTMTIKSEGLGWTESRGEERVCAHINKHTHSLMLTEYFKKEKGKENIFLNCLGVSLSQNTRQSKRKKVIFSIKISGTCCRR